jgi:hypothetical protein
MIFGQTRRRLSVFVILVCFPVILEENFLGVYVGYYCSSVLSMLVTRRTPQSHSGCDSDRSCHTSRARFLAPGSAPYISVTLVNL